MSRDVAQVSAGIGGCAPEKFAAHLIPSVTFRLATAEPVTNL